MAISARPLSNIWVAAGDGDLNRVRELVELHSASPNGPDENSYTPMHAAASYGHIHVLEYLVSRGGDVNVTDDDGDTPLYTVENLETAQYLVEHGAVVDRRNSEGISPIEHLSEDFQEVANYLQSLSSSLGQNHSQNSVVQPSQHSQDVASETLTSGLIASVQDILRRAEEEGRDPDEELQQAVARAVLDGLATGYQLTDSGTGGDRDRSQAPGDDEGSQAKRSRTE
ncbi:ankyrin [Coprinopsis marcescibilis]|uniref:Ankyrin n=1 Tax=Coprinopsis marcescibilis TaxID=230819 RepID=A0A5C3L5L5_COPMA|nr:ankyrin [Coprinopsis marcescibilis]